MPTTSGVGFEHQADAVRFVAALRERLAAFALTLHGEKTRLRPPVIIGFRQRRQQSRRYGSVRGARSNARPYRDKKTRVDPVRPTRPRGCRGR